MLIETQTKSLSELIAALDPENPRDHDEDIEGLAMRLLHNGWLKFPTYNAKLKKLVGGHGRVQACELLVQQSKEWFADRWLDWATENQAKYSEQELLENQERYVAGYWSSIPVLVVKFDVNTHRVALLALNHSEGQDDRAIIAKLIASMGTLATGSAGFTEAERNSFLAEFNLRSDRVSQEEIADREAIASKLALKPKTRGKKRTRQVESDDEEDVEVVEGGANFNGDPVERKPTLYPLCVTLSGKRLAKIEALKEKKGVKTDMAILMMHPCFAKKNEQTPVD